MDGESDNARANGYGAIGIAWRRVAGFCKKTSLDVLAGCTMTLARALTRLAGGLAGCVRSERMRTSGDVFIDEAISKASKASKATKANNSATV